MPQPQVGNPVKLDWPKIPASVQKMYQKSGNGPDSEFILVAVSAIYKNGAIIRVNDAYIGPQNMSEEDMRRFDPDEMENDERYKDVIEVPFSYIKSGTLN